MSRRVMRLLVECSVNTEPRTPDHQNGGRPMRALLGDRARRNRDCGGGDPAARRSGPG